MKNSIDAQTFIHIGNRITAVSGLKIISRNQEKLKSAIEQRMNELKINDLSNYASFILKSRPELTDELNALIELIVNTESYFFRDKSLFELLHTKLFPEIIHRQRHRRELRIWSAGCSSGEEAFSLAICLLQTLPDWKMWNIKIIGTDISKSMLEIAKKGYYKSNSLRLMDKHLLNYFNAENDGVKIHSSLRDIVSFVHLNLLSDFSYDKTLADMDLIICRNVFIYFDKKAIESVVGQFNKILSKQGILIAGHGELIGISHNLEPERCEQSVIYRKKGLL